MRQMFLKKLSDKGYAIILCPWGEWRARSNLNPVKQLDLGQVPPILPGCKTAWRGIVAWDTGAIKYPSVKPCRAVFFFFFFCVCVCVLSRLGEHGRVGLFFVTNNTLKCQFLFSSHHDIIVLQIWGCRSNGYRLWPKFMTDVVLFFFFLN